MLAGFFAHQRVCVTMYQPPAVGLTTKNLGYPKFQKLLLGLCGFTYAIGLDANGLREIASLY
jgi:hypothetical protein